MATNNLLTTMNWVDLMKTIDPSGQMAEIINPTVENNSILKHAQWMMANNGTTHQGTRVSTLPSSSDKVLGLGTAPSAGSHVNFVEDTKVRETWIQIEDQLLQKHPNPEAYMRQQGALALQGLTQDMVQDILYGNKSTSNTNINGLAIRYPSLNSNRQTGKVVSAGGSASNVQSSAWLIKWGEDGVYFIYPQDMPNGGIQTDTFPAENIRDSNGKIMRVYPMRIRVGFGLVVKNPRYIARLCNMDATSASSANFATNVENNLITILNDMPNEGSGAVLYANNFVKSAFDIRAKDKGNVWYDGADAWGHRVTKFLDTPIYKLERLIATEAVVS